MKIHHVALRTRDLERLERFYATTLGLEVVRPRDDRSVWLDADGTLVMLERAEPGEPPLPVDTKELVAFTIAPDRHAFYTDRLNRAGVAIEAHTAFTIYFRDPDGRRVGLTSYPEALA